MRWYLILMLSVCFLLFSGCEEKEKIQSMEITSPAFENGKQIPEKYTCDGENISPPLNFSGVPKGAKSLVIIMDDPDAPGKTFTHWLVWNIPANTKGLPEGAKITYPQGKNDFGEIGYGGPCPPPGTGIHHYRIKVFALDTFLDLSEGAARKDLEKAMSGHVMAEGTLIGLYGR